MLLRCWKKEGVSSLLERERERAREEEEEDEKSQLGAV
jgi:hypothetical protein